MATKEYEYIRDVINTHGLVRVLEWGSGASTLWFSKNCKVKWLAIEHNVEWFDAIKENLPENAEIRLLQDKDDYINVEGEFDLILIDGIYRQECLKRAFKVLSKSPQARILLHDSGRKAYKDWFSQYPHQIIFEGEGWLGDGWDHRGLAEFKHE